MFAMYEISPNTIYLAFPRFPDGRSIPDSVMYDWLIENIAEPNWGIANNQTTGIFLTHQDATAFKLRFGV